MDEQIASAFADISKQLDGIEGRLTSHVDSKLSGIEGRLTSHISKQLDAAVTELKQQAQVYKEELKDDVKKAAEGYDATLKKIERELVDLNQKVDTGFHDHDLVLKNHIGRIIKLEERR
jgi:gas vesicle protein